MIDNQLACKYSVLKEYLLFETTIKHQKRFVMCVGLQFGMELTI